MPRFSPCVLSWCTRSALLWVSLGMKHLYRLVRFSHHIHVVRFEKSSVRFSEVKGEKKKVIFRKWLVKLGFKQDANSGFLGESHVCSPPLNPNPPLLLEILCFVHHVFLCSTMSSVHALWNWHRRLYVSGTKRYLVLLYETQGLTCSPISVLCIIFLS